MHGGGTPSRCTNSRGPRNGIIGGGEVPYLVLAFAMMLSLNDRR